MPKEEGVEAVFIAADETEHLLGLATEENISALLQKLPWGDERKRSDELKMISPTLTLKSAKTPEILSFSVLGTEDSTEEPLEFLAMFEQVEQFESVRWFRRTLMEGRANYDMHDVSLEQAQELARLFIAESYAELATRFPVSRRRVFAARAV